MPNPLIFFIVVIVIDLVLKSIRNKKKMEKSRRQSMEQAKNKNVTSSEKPSDNRPIRELRKLLDEELEREKMAKRQEMKKPDISADTIDKRMTREELIASQREKVSKHSELERMRRRREELQKDRQMAKEEYRAPIKQSLVAKSQEDKQEFREDILKGIIFSEILGKPKSLRK